MLEINHDSTYDTWAKIYNKSLGPQYCQKNLPPFEKLLQQYLAKGVHILDLCCGTGQMAQYLLEQGYQVTGLDISKEMLNYARENAATATFIQDDARYFKLPPTFDAVISPSASLNHIMSIEELKNVFQNVYAALLDNGIFLLGICLEEAYSSWNGSITEGDIQDNYAWASRDSYNPQDKIAQFQITIFQLLEKNWQRSDITYQVKPYQQSEIVSILKTVGFREVTIYDDDGNLAELQYNDYAIIAGRK
jgi:SAM-dependent methyltransferase